MKIYISIMVLASLAIIGIAGCEKDESGANEKEIKIVPTDIEAIGQVPLNLIETSGIVVSNSNRIWSHNDKNNTNQLYLIDTTGTLIKTITVTNAQNIDWEDLAVDNLGRVYINNAGNNNNDRTDLSIYRIPNPNEVDGNTIEAEIINFSYEDQTEFPPSLTNRNYDVEAIAWRNDSIYLFTKDRSTPYTGYTKNYVVPATPGTYSAVLIDSFFVSNVNYPAPITAADFNHTTGELVLLTKERILSFKNYSGNKFFKGDITDFQFTSTIGQAEAIGFVDNSKIYITEEGSTSSPGNIYKVILP